MLCEFFETGKHLLLKEPTGFYNWKLQKKKLSTPSQKTDEGYFNGEKIRRRMRKKDLREKIREQIEEETFREDEKK